MRSLLLLALFLATAAAAEREAVTLMDGRTFVGVYDETTGNLLVDGGKISLRIPPDQVKARATAPALPVQVQKPAPSSTASLPAQRRILDVQQAIVAIGTKAQRDKEQAAVDWLLSLTIRVPEKYSLPADPRQSERELAMKNENQRSFAEYLLRMQAELRKKPEDRDARVSVLNFVQAEGVDQGPGAIAECIGEAVK